ncbi:RidA family protein [Pelolinea submarina]|uniref:Endoribonuclease L-PSP n=1 Tax=Pelolinea submarina TaxID=913107 RepID=A0A347ZSS9_9CHLR|nr:RidA family protein [Pelolinea submarina]REG11066.1 endoribonuclease L-PSP [Pelolinea submarina]BBB48360.1 2-iminobutanoate/2-iminopropanoate deaminase [Pelolinea submarina]
MQTFGKKDVIGSPNAPKAVGPYSAAIKTGPFVFMSGQLGLDPQSGSLVEGGVEAQTKQALTNLQSILQSNGLDMEAIVKTTVFLQDMDDFAKMNAVYAEFFKSDPPARSTIEVAALPKGGLVEIEAIALTA